MRLRHGKVLNHDYVSTLSRAMWKELETMQFPPLFRHPISRHQPAYIVVLMDQSAGMAEKRRSEFTDQTLAQFASNEINELLDELTCMCTGDSAVKNWFDVSVIGYRTDQNGEPVVGSAFLGNLEGRKRVPLSDIAENILETQTGVMKWYNAQTGDLEETEVEKPVWIKPIADGLKPMCHAFHKACFLAEEWVTDQYRQEFCLPPIVINITNGDLSGIEADVKYYADRIKSLGTKHGKAMLWHCVITTCDRGPLFCPTDSLRLNDEGLQMLLEISSVLRQDCVHVAKEAFPALNTESKGFLLNTHLTLFRNLFSIGS